jgi:putative flippase GtrA
MIRAMRNPNEAPMPGHHYSVPMYIGAGGIATASHYAVTIAAVELLGAPPLAASAGGFAVGAAVKYFLNYFVAFRSGERHGVALPRFALTLAALFALNAGIFTLFQQVVGLHYMVAQVLTTILLIPPGYLLSRLWVFR